ncbi:malate dehydrogenase [Peziza echinospora]|nr:malate dehydrogenase [Peziza echinospora]
MSTSTPPKRTYTPTKMTRVHTPPLSTYGPLPCALTGPALLSHPLFNKGAGFPLNERRLFDLHGLLPSAVHTLDLQVSRAYGQLLLRGNDSLAKNTFLASLRAQNLVLYYKLLETHIEELMRIIYTPTQGDAIMRYSELFRVPEGCFLNITDSESEMETALRGWGEEGDVDYIVVTDSEEILGIGDWGVGGIGICTAKLGLMTLCGGLHPNRTLPVVLDCGTDNDKLLNDDLYLGLRQPRVRGKKYDDFVHTFISLKTKIFPSAILHFEDFGLLNARRFLNQYRPKIPCVNDDMQATGCVTTAAVYAYCFVTQTPMDQLRVIVFGAGTAGLGIADMIRDAIATEREDIKDVSPESDELQKSKLNASQNHIWLVDKPGLLLKSTEGLHAEQKDYAKNPQDWKDVDTTSLQAIVARVKPHVLIGTSTKAGAFTEDVIREMHKHVKRPAIFPLSNPTRLHEAQPTDILAWTNNEALAATGGPFPPVNGIEISECNNALCFPGIGLGMVLAKASICTDEMLVSATKALAKLSPALAAEKDEGKSLDEATNRPLLPGIKHIKQISMKIAMEVVKTAVKQGVSTVEDIPVEDADLLLKWVAKQMWKPEYRELMRVSGEGADGNRAAKGLLGIGRRGSVIERN